MISYLAKRILLFIPTLLVIALLAFALSKIAPGDMVLQHESEEIFGNISTQRELERAEGQYRLVAQKLGVDKPAFYFTINPKAFPDTLYRIWIQDQRETVRKLIAQYGNWPQIETYFHQIRDFELKLLALPTDLPREEVTEIKRAVRDLYVAYEHPVIESKFLRMEKAMLQDSFLTAILGGVFDDFKNNYRKVIEEATPQKGYIPDFKWHGRNNQFHHWFFNFISGDFGYSLQTRQKAADRIVPALKWTLLLNLLAIFIAYAVSVPIGVRAAAKQGSRFDKTSTLGLFMLYSLPSFWVGTMLLVFFTTKVYGMEWFHGVWAGNMDFSKFGEDFWRMAGHLVLPVFCIAYPAFAFLSRQMRGGMVEVLRQDYIRTARAKGVPEKKVIWKHAFRNALFPLITIFASVFPAAIVGSVAIEYIFNIPGMGKLMLNTILENDWPIVFAVLMLGAILTLIGILVADVLYAMADPRVSFRKG